MNEHRDTLPPRGAGCSTARTVLRDLWVDERLDDLPTGSERGSGGGRLPSPADGPSERSRAAQEGPCGSDRLSSDLVDPAILLHIERCPSCRREAAELERLGRSLYIGLDSLCGAIADRMEGDIEGTLQRIRGESQAASFLRRSRLRLRFVLWISFLAFTFLASVLLAMALHKALQGQ